MADRFRVTPFDIFKQECSEVISLMNHFLEKDAEEQKKAKKAEQADGFWDF